MAWTFKENCPDIRNTKVVDIYHTLSEYTQNITIYDPWADPEKVMHEYGITINSVLPDGKYDLVILAVAHSQFKEINIKEYTSTNCVIYDVKGVLDRSIIDGRL